MIPLLIVVLLVILICISCGVLSPPARITQVLWAMLIVVIVILFVEMIMGHALLPLNYWTPRP